MNIYVASSWKNTYQPGVVTALRGCGHEVYDFRNPKEGDHGFSWSEIDPEWESWTLPQFLKALHSDPANRGFDLDFGAMMAADACVLVLPCGNDAHLEAGFFMGKGKPVFVYVPYDWKPGLMYKLTSTEWFTYDLPGLLGVVTTFERNNVWAKSPKS